MNFSARAASLLALAGLCACADDPESYPASIDNAVILSAFTFSGTGVYLGEGWLLTNWHMCTRESDVLLYNASTPNQPAYREGAPLDGERCEDGTTTVRPAASDSCYPVLNSGVVRFPQQSEPPGWSDIEPAYGGKVMFAQKSLELCVIKLDENVQRTVPASVAPLTIDLTPVHVGQEVVVAGFPLGRTRPAREHCKVTAAPTLLRDPDLAQPSDTEVVSFAIDCESTQHGSSGSPVLDATTGALLGLLWTGECQEVGRCRPPAYVSAASAWPSQGDRPPAQYSHLQELLDTFGAP